MDNKYLSNIHSSYLLNELVRQYIKNDRIIIAYDFDNTVHPTSCRDCSYVQSVIRAAANMLDPYFIVFTCNTDLKYVTNYLRKNNLPYDFINENCPTVPEWVTSTNKIYYNLLLDDKAGLTQAVEALDDLIYIIQNGKIEEYLNV